MVAAVVEHRPFGPTRDGTEVTLFTLHGANGFRVELLDYGAIIHAVHVPARDGTTADVVLGYDDLAGYEDDASYHGAVAGRSAGRIGGAAFTLDGRRYDLARNDGANHLHGGVRGFSKVRWRATPLDGALRLEHHSPEGDEGYPGAVDVRVTYSLAGPQTLVVEYEARSSQPTPVNLTQHAYFNLAGEGSGSILGQRLHLDADEYAPLGEGFITTGDFVTVQGTPFDFRSTHAIGERIATGDPQLRLAGGYDHSFVVRGWNGALRPAASLSEPVSGRSLDVFTTEPAIHLYTGNFLDGSRVGKHGRRYARHDGLCLEAQHFPDAPNKPRFPSTILRPGDVLRSRTEFRFGSQ